MGEDLFLWGLITKFYSREWSAWEIEHFLGPKRLLRTEGTDFWETLEDFQLGSTHASIRYFSIHINKTSQRVDWIRFEYKQPIRIEYAALDTLFNLECAIEPHMNPIMYSIWKVSGCGRIYLGHEVGNIQPGIRIVIIERHDSSTSSCEMNWKIGAGKKEAGCSYNLMQGL